MMLFVELLDEVFGDLSFGVLIRWAISVNDRKFFLLGHMDQIPFMTVDERPNESDARSLKSHLRIEGCDPSSMDHVHE